MAVVPSPSERILKMIVPAMEKRGYTYRKSGHRFLKDFEFGKDEFHLSFDGRGGLVAVSGAYGISFDRLHKQLKNAVDYAPWVTVGGTFLNARVKESRFFLFDDNYANLTPSQKKDIPSALIHPQSRIEQGVEYLLEVHDNWAQPLFDQHRTYRQLANTFHQYLREGGYGKSMLGRILPHEEYVICLAMLLAASLGDDNIDEIFDYAAKLEAKNIVKKYVPEAEMVKQFINSPDFERLDC